MTCTTPGCQGTVLARGLCRRCYTLDRAGRMPPCRTPGCGRPQLAFRLCAACYHRQRRARLREADHEAPPSTGPVAVRFGSTPLADPPTTSKNSLPDSGQTDHGT